MYIATWLLVDLATIVATEWPLLEVQVLNMLLAHTIYSWKHLWYWWKYLPIEKYAHSYTKLHGVLRKHTFTIVQTNPIFFVAHMHTCTCMHAHMVCYMCACMCVYWVICCVWCTKFDTARTTCTYVRTSIDTQSVRYHDMDTQGNSISYNSSVGLTLM